MREKGLIFNKSKCEYGKDKLEFFGYVFFKEGILLDLKKVEEVVNFLILLIVLEVCSLLGMINYCLRFILDYVIKIEFLCKFIYKD